MTIYLPALQLHAAELCEDLGGGGAGVAVAPLCAVGLALFLLRQNLGGCLFAEHLLAGALSKGDDAVDGGGASLEDVEQLLGCLLDGCIAVVGSDGFLPCERASLVTCVLACDVERMSTRGAT